MLFVVDQNQFRRTMHVIIIRPCVRTLSTKCRVSLNIVRWGVLLKCCTVLHYKKHHRPILHTQNNTTCNTATKNIIKCSVHYFNIARNSSQGFGDSFTIDSHTENHSISLERNDEHNALLINLGKNAQSFFKMKVGLLFALKSFIRAY